MARKTAIEAIFDRMSVSQSGCWEVSGSLDKDGYAKVGSKKRAHRVSYEHFNGTANGSLVCHSCDNRRCVNPEHLWLGTNAQNTADRNAKGRQANRSRIRPTISVEVAHEIRNALALGATGRDMARSYGLSEGMISNIKFGRTWHFRSAA